MAGLRHGYTGPRPDFLFREMEKYNRRWFEPASKASGSMASYAADYAPSEGNGKERTTASSELSTVDVAGSSTADVPSDPTPELSDEHRGEVQMLHGQIKAMLKEGQRIDLIVEQGVEKYGPSAMKGILSGGSLARSVELVKAREYVHSKSLELLRKGVLKEDDPGGGGADEAKSGQDVLPRLLDDDSSRSPSMERILRENVDDCPSKQDLRAATLKDRRTSPSLRKESRKRSQDRRRSRSRDRGRRSRSRNQWRSRSRSPRRTGSHNRRRSRSSNGRRSHSHERRRSRLDSRRDSKSTARRLSRSPKDQRSRSRLRNRSRSHKRSRSRNRRDSLNRRDSKGSGSRNRHSGQPDSKCSRSPLRSSSSRRSRSLHLSGSRQPTPISNSHDRECTTVDVADDTRNIRSTAVSRSSDRSHRLSHRSQSPGCERDKLVTRRDGGISSFRSKESFWGESERRRPYNHNRYRQHILPPAAHQDAECDPFMEDIKPLLDTPEWPRVGSGISYDNGDRLRRSPGMIDRIVHRRQNSSPPEEKFPRCRTPDLMHPLRQEFTIDDWYHRRELPEEAPHSSGYGNSRSPLMWNRSQSPYNRTGSAFGQEFVGEDYGGPQRDRAASPRIKSSREADHRHLLPELPRSMIDDDDYPRSFDLEEGWREPLDDRNRGPRFIDQRVRERVVSPTFEDYNRTGIEGFGRAQGRGERYCNERLYHRPGSRFARGSYRGNDDRGRPDLRQGKSANYIMRFANFVTGEMIDEAPPNPDEAETKPPPAAAGLIGSQHRRFSNFAYQVYPSRPITAVVCDPIVQKSKKASVDSEKLETGAVYCDTSKSGESKPGKPFSPEREAPLEQPDGQDSRLDGSDGKLDIQRFLGGKIPSMESMKQVESFKAQLEHVMSQVRATEKMLSTAPEGTVEAPVEANTKTNVLLPAPGLVEFDVPSTRADSSEAKVLRAPIVVGSKQPPQVFGRVPLRGASPHTPLSVQGRGRGSVLRNASSIRGIRGNIPRRGDWRAPAPNARSQINCDINKPPPSLASKLPQVNLPEPKKSTTTQEATFGPTESNTSSGDKISAFPALPSFADDSPSPGYYFRRQDNDLCSVHESFQSDLQPQGQQQESAPAPRQEYYYRRDRDQHDAEGGLQEVRHQIGPSSQAERDAGTTGKLDGPWLPPPTRIAQATPKKLSEAGASVGFDRPSDGRWEEEYNHRQHRGGQYDDPPLSGRPEQPLDQDSQQEPVTGRSMDRSVPDAGLSDSLIGVPSSVENPYAGSDPTMELLKARGFL